MNEPLDLRRLPPSFVLAAALAVTAVPVSIAATTNAAELSGAEEPIVITNDDLPETLSVSVIGPAPGEDASRWPTMEEIAAIAKLNEEARQSYAESRRVAEERSGRDDRERYDDDYRGYLPLGSYRYGGFGRYDRRFDRRFDRHDAGHFDRGPHHGGKGGKGSHSPRLRDALPPPQDGWVNRPTKHLRGNHHALGSHGPSHRTGEAGHPARSRALGFVRTR